MVRKQHHWKWCRQGVSLWMALLLLLGLLPGTALADEPDEAAAPDHVIINQVYGGGKADQDGTPIARSFVELYNPTGDPVSLNGYTVNVENNGKVTGTYSVALSGVELAANSSYLIVGKEYTTEPATNYWLPEADQTDDRLLIDNKVYTVTLLSGETEVDSVGADDETIKVSKQKSLRRNDHIDTGANSDFTVIVWEKGKESPLSDTVTAYGEAFLAAYAPRNSKGEYGTLTVPTTPIDPAPGEGEGTETAIQRTTGWENGTADLDLTQIGRYDSGMTNADGGVMEIVDYNKANGYAYAVNGQSGRLAAISLESLGGEHTDGVLRGTEIDVRALIEANDDGFTYGDMTSVAVSPDGAALAAAIQAEDYTANGRVALFTCRADGTLTFERAVETGVQPDMVTFTPDGSRILTANEGEPREGYTDENAVDPAGSVTIIDTASDRAVTVGFEAYDGEDARRALVDDGVILKTDTAPSVDLEPEYIACTGTTAYISLQEANAVAVLDIASGTFTGIYSVGFQDYSRIPVDLGNDDGQYAPETYADLFGIRMPDGISLVTIGGTDYLLTANEGDSRAWPVETEADVNEIKSKTSPNGRKFEKKVTWFDDGQYDGLEDGVDYLFGGRSFTMFRVTANGLEEVFDSGSDFESRTAEYLPDYFNCSNDSLDLEDRSGKKGPEPETVVTGTVNGRTYAFVTLERIGGVMVYDITDPAGVSYVNYINSRDFSADVAADDSPEGLKFVPASTSPTGEALLLAACEVGGTVAVYQLTSRLPEETPDTPAGAGGLKIAVISDCHIYDGDTLGKTGDAFAAYLAGDRKMLVESTKILAEAIERIKASDAEYVLIPGDLTKDGETVNHSELAGMLAELEAAGKEVFIINGNHDLSNAAALSYEGDSTASVDTVDRDAFREIYAAFGYDQAIAKDPDSLSYAVDLGGDYRLIAMDACIYNNDTGSGRHQETAGAFQESTLNWVLEQTEQAIRDGKRPIGMMHHGLVAHTDIQPTFFPEYLVKDYEEVSQKLSNAGMNLVFTGHFHSQDAAAYTDAATGSSLVDIETGSLVTYPSPIRYVTLGTGNVESETEISYTSAFIDSVKNLTADDLSDPTLSAALTRGFQTYSYAYLMKGLKGQVPGMLTAALMSLGLDQAAAAQQAQALAASTPFAQYGYDGTLADFLAACMSLHYAGDEQQNSLYPVLAPLVSGMLASKDAATNLLGQAAYALITDTNTTPDNSGTVVLTALPTYPEEPAEPVEPAGPSVSSSGSDGDDDETVLVSGSANGRITVSDREASKGDRVTITVRPNDGYQVDAVTVTTQSGKAVSVTDNGDGTYTYIQPSGTVRVSAAFVRIQSTALRFTDVPAGCWAEDAIGWAYENGYMKGSTALTFQPDGAVTRQQLWMILARLSGASPADMAGARTWAMDSGVSDGSSPGSLVSRQQLVTILYRYARLLGYDVSGAADLSGYPDQSGVAGYAEAPMGWAVASGIVSGTADGLLRPAGATTRAQFAVILQRFCAGFAG